MEIPVLSRFIDGLKLFIADKRLRWLLIVFLIGAAIITVLRFLGEAAGNAIYIGAVFPMFFLLTAFMSVIGQQRFIASDESYKKSAILFIPWLIISTLSLLLFVAYAAALLLILYVIIAYLGWIIFQSYLASRTSLGYAAGVQIKGRSTAMKFVFWFMNILTYVIIWGALIGSVILFGISDVWRFGLALLGVFIASGFNFINGLIIAAERNKTTADNITVLGFFIALYSGYFIYNLTSGNTGGFDPVGVFTSVFFLLYAMSSVGRSLASRADLQTRWRLSKETAATVTFFFASGYIYIEALLTVLIAYATGGMLYVGEEIDDFLKLIIFPFVALVMELQFIRRSRKEGEAPTEELPPTDEVVEPEAEEVEPEEEVVEEVPQEEPSVEEEPPEEPITEEPVGEEEYEGAIEDVEESEPLYDEEETEEASYGEYDEETTEE